MVLDPRGFLLLVSVDAADFHKVLCLFSGFCDFDVSRLVDCGEFLVLNDALHVVAPVANQENEAVQHDHQKEEKLGEKRVTEEALFQAKEREMEK